jgi:hypothetical protein
MGRRRNPFLIKHFKTKITSYERGRIYDYDYYHNNDFLKDEYTIYLSTNDIKNLNKESDIFKLYFELTQTQKLVEDDPDLRIIPVKFTTEEFINFKRTKILENEIKKGE